MKPKTKKTAPTSPQFDLDSGPAQPAVVIPAEEPKTEPKTFRASALGAGRRNLFRDLRDGEIA